MPLTTSSVIEQPWRPTLGSIWIQMSPTWKSQAMMSGVIMVSTIYLLRKCFIFVNHSLQYLAEVWEMFSSHYLLPDSPPTTLLDRVRKGCVSITWLVPSKLIRQLVKIAKIDTHFFQKHRILKVTVEDQCVYNENASTSVSMHLSLPSHLCWFSSTTAVIIPTHSITTV